MHRSTSSMLALVTLAISAFSTPARALPPAPVLQDNLERLLYPDNAAAPGPLEPAVHPPEDGRGCRGDLFTIGVPVGRELPGRMREVIDNVASGLGTLTSNDTSLTPRRVARVAVARVLPGNDRHWLIGLLDDNGRRMRVKPARVCEVVAEIRRIAVATVGDILSIGRECEASMQADWHETAMTPAPQPGLPPLAALPGVFGAPARTVRVAVIDGPMSHAGLAWSSAQAENAEPTVLYPHADAMARLIREMAPTAEIVGYPALVDGATGTPISAVAIALNLALRAAEPPHIINLSLGWPAEMGRPIELRGRKTVTQPNGRAEVVGCETIEDPAGESVRELLGAATDSGIVVVAAAGNRVGPQPLAGQGLLKPYNQYPRLFPCLDAADVAQRMQAVDSGELFFPAAWSHVPTCVDGPPLSVRPAVPGGMPIVAVGAYGQHAEPTIGDATLFAPGIGVPLGPVPSALSQRLPRHMTGTSVAAALTSGFIAQLAAQGPVLDMSGAIRGSATSCDQTPRLFLRRCETQPLPQMSRRPTRVEMRAESRKLTDVNGAPPVLDQAAAAGLGPQPTIDPCDDDCRMLARRLAQSGRAELRMRFAGMKGKLSMSDVEIEVRKGKSATRYGLGSAAVKAMNTQLLTGKIAMDLIDVPLEVIGDKNGQQVALNDGLEADMSVDLVYTLTEADKQPTRRRSRLIPGYIP